jgi:hypothetical protein
MNIDPDIQAAFSTAPPAAAVSSSPIDDDIKAAFPANEPAANADESASETGAAETALSLGTGALASIPAGLTYLGTGGSLEKARAVQQALTYEPRTEQGKEALKAVGDIVGAPGRAILKGADILEPSGQLSAALSDVGERAGFATVPIPTLGALRGAKATGSSFGPLSLSAAQAAPNISRASPEIQAAVSRAGGAVNPETLSRHLEADSLPVKMQLTEGQATQNPVLLSREQNMRGAQPQLAQHFNNQNGQLVQNVQAIRDAVGPDVFSTNPVEHGDTLIGAYKAKAAAADADISSKYQALRDAAGGQFPVSAPKLFQNVTSKLNDQLLLDHAPKAVMNTLGRLADEDNMTFQNFESLRTNLARTMRSSADGNERAAAGVIRSAMEELPLAPGAAKLKPLADEARSAARTQFQALEADPAYKAAVNETVPPDRFVQKFIVGGTRDNVAQMKENLAHDPTATQTMGVAALDHLRRSAGINDMGEGNFSQAGFNRHLQALDPKLSSLVDPATAEQLNTLGNVARYTQAQPRGSFVNNSNTLTGALAQHAGNLLEGAANMKTGGVGGTLVRNALQRRAMTKAAQQAMEPGAGLTR